MKSNRMKHRPHPRWLAWIVLAASLILTAGFFPAVNATAQPDPSDSSPERPIVLGTGNRLSGRLPVIFVGPRDHYGVPDIKLFAAAIAARCDLKLELRVVETLESPDPEAAIVLLGHVPTAREAAFLRASPGTLAVLGVDRTEDLPQALVQDAVATRLKPGDPDHGWLRDLPAQDTTDPGILSITLAGEKAPRLFAWSAIARERFETFLLVLVRNAVEHETGLRHVPTAFENISSRMEHDRLVLDVAAAIPGTLTQEVLDLTGRVILAEGSIEPVDLKSVPDPDRTLLRLRFQGRDRVLVDEVRYWFRDLLPETLPCISVRGPSSLPVGEPLRLRVDVTTADYAPVAGAQVQGRAGTQTRSAVTDTAGSAWLVYPDLNTTVPGILLIQVQVQSPHFDQTVEGRLPVVARPRRLLLEMDRPVVRPGQAVRIRAVLIDSLSCHAIQGQPVTLEVTDPEDRLLVRTERTTGAFGEATIRVPISDALAEGTYAARAAQGTVSAEATFRVEDLKLPRFRIRVRLDKDRFQPAEPITGTVEAETFFGEPLQGATVRVELPARRPDVVRAGARLDTRGIAPFTLEAPERHAFVPVLFVTVDHHGAVVRKRVEVRVEFPPSLRTRIVWSTQPSPLVAGQPGTIHVNTVDETGNHTLSCRFDWRIRGARPRQGSDYKFLSIPVNRDHPSGTIDLYVRAEQPAYQKTDTPVVTELEVKIPIQEGVSLEMPLAARPGSTFPVVIHASRKTALVHLDLVAGEQLLAGSSVVLTDGQGQAVVAVPWHARGPAMVVARFADQHGPIAAQRLIDLVTAPLTVSVTPDRAEARPGETVACAVQVQDATGRGVPSLLDVRCLDQINCEAYGDFGVPIQDQLRVVPPRQDISILGRFEPVVARARVVVESDRLARPVLAEAARALEAGQWPRTTLPWGARIQLTRIRDRIFLDAEPAVTRGPNSEHTPLPHGPETTIQTAMKFPCLLVRTLLPPRVPHQASAGTRRQASWFHACQAPDGSFPVLSPQALGDLHPHEQIGDPWLEPGTTGLVMLAHYGAGYTHQAGRYKSVLQNALDHLRSIQNASGFFGDPEAPWAVLNHAICTQAVAEAYGMTTDPLLRPVVERALSALAARQRPDGSFSEAGLQDAGLVCTAWTSQALCSARSWGLPLPGGVVDRIRVWLEARTDPETGRVAMGKDEIVHYPFSRLDSIRHTAALPALIRILLLGQDPEKHPVLMKLGKALATVCPEPGDRDLHGLYFGTMAMYQFGGPLWRTWNRVMKRSIVDAQIQNGPGRDAWASDGRVGRVGTTALGTLCLLIYYRYGRGPRFHDDREKPPPGWFADLLISDLAYPTAPDGRTSILLRLPGRITPWDLRVGAWDGKGGYGVGHATVRASLPLQLEVDLPSRWHEGDCGRVPVRVLSRLPADAKVTVRVRSARGIAVCGDASREVTVPARGTALIRFELAATEPGAGRLVLEATDGTHEHVVERTIWIRTRSAPFTLYRFPRAGESLRIGDAIPAGAVRIHAHLTVTADPLGDTNAGLKELRGMAEKTTRFEEKCAGQTVVDIHTGLAALRLRQAIGRIDDDCIQRVREHIAVGYRSLLEGELEGGGFTYWNEEKTDFRWDVTALAIHVLSDLKAVTAVDEAVDEAVIRRAATVLEKHVPENPIGRVYAWAALARAGRPVESASILDALRREKDPYVLALAVCHDLVPESLRTRVRSQLESSAVWIGTEVVWKPVGETLPDSTMDDWLETTALAVEALLRLGGSHELVERGLLALRRGFRSCPRNTYPSSRGTGIWLRALRAAIGAGPAEGSLVVRRGNELQGSLRIGDEIRSASLDLGAVHANDRLAFAFEGQGTPHITLRITGTSTTPPDHPRPFEVSAVWSDDSLRTWDRSFTARSRSTTGMNPGTTINFGSRCRSLRAFEPDREGLQTAAKQAGFKRAEVREGRVFLYRDWMPSSEPITLRIPFVAGMAGRFHSGAVRAWPESKPELASVAASHLIQVGPADPATPQGR